MTQLNNLFIRRSLKTNDLISRYLATLMYCSLPNYIKHVQINGERNNIPQYYQVGRMDNTEGFLRHDVSQPRECIQMLRTL